MATKERVNPVIPTNTKKITEIEQELSQVANQISETPAPVVTPVSSKPSIPLNTSYKTPALVYELPKGAISNSLTTVTKNGAITTATITNVNGYDKLAITGGTDENSRIQISGRLSCLNRKVHKLRLLVNALGTTPIVGFYFNSAGAPYTVFTAPSLAIYANLLTGVITRSDSGVHAVTNQNEVTAGVAVGQIIEVLMDFSLHNKINFYLKVENPDGRVSYSLVGTHTGHVSGEITIYSHFMNLIMSDGTYTILSYEEYSSDGFRPKVVTIGDSMGTGVNILPTERLDYQFEQKCGAKMTTMAETSTLLQGMEANIGTILTLQPEVVLFFNVLDAMYNHDNANPSNPNYAAFLARYQKLVGIIKSMGAKPIFLKLNFFTAFGSFTQCANYATFLDTNFPGEMVADLMSVPFQSDNTGSHPNGTYYGIIADKVIEQLTLNNLL